ncbi:MAG: endonuclease/exonuclease/phosphatase family protein [Burkholderiaceae bacterium]|nr:endonuclease/exonuclease/phosphatase family protein [Burkholderiaceae bacterium]
MLMGDFNATPWSGVAHAMERTGLLRPSSLVPTSGAMPGNAISFLPIDQALGTPHWCIHTGAVNPSVGSDHRIVRVGLEPGSPASTRATPSWRAITFAVLLVGLLWECVCRRDRLLAARSKG